MFATSAPILQIENVSHVHISSVPNLGRQSPWVYFAVAVGFATFAWFGVFISIQL